MYMIIFLLIYKVFASFLKDYHILKKYEKELNPFIMSQIDYKSIIPY